MLSVVAGDLCLSRQLWDSRWYLLLQKAACILRLFLFLLIFRIVVTIRSIKYVWMGTHEGGKSSTRWGRPEISYLENHHHPNCITSLEICVSSYTLPRLLVHEAHTERLLFNPSLFPSFGTRSTPMISLVDLDCNTAMFQWELEISVPCVFRDADREALQLSLVSAASSITPLSSVQGKAGE